MNHALALDVLERIHSMSPEMIDFFSVDISDRENAIVKMSTHPGFPEAEKLIQDILFVLKTRSPLVPSILSALNEKVPRFVKNFVMKHLEQ